MTPSERRKHPAADLHVHTTHSDGACTPQDVVRAAASVGLAAVAITDHDTVSAVAVARSEAERLGIELISGIELTAERDGRETHLLGYFVRENDPDLIEVTRQLRDARASRIEAMVARLQILGLRIDLNAIRGTFPRATIGRKHLADWLTLTKQVASPRDAFNRYLGDEGPAQVPKPRVPWVEAIELIHRAGGVVALAHPRFNLRQEELDSYVSAGLDGIEVAGPGIDPRAGARWRVWAGERRLVAVSGSDFHAHASSGRWVGQFTTPMDQVEMLRGRAGSERD